MIPAFFFGCRYPMISQPCDRLQARRRVSSFFRARYERHFGIGSYAPLVPFQMVATNNTAGQIYVCPSIDIHSGEKHG